MTLRDRMTPRINSYRAVVGSIVAVGWLLVYSYVWVTNGNPTLFMDTITGLVVVSSLVGLYGRGAVRAAANIINGDGRE